MTDSDRVDVPHYTQGGIEVIDILRHKMTNDQFEGFLLGNVLKYLFRYPHKGHDREDLDKALTYLGWLREFKERT